MRIIVTGASKGIGRGIARVLAGAGHRIGLLARTVSELSALKDEFKAKRYHCEIEPCNLRSYDETNGAIVKI